LDEQKRLENDSLHHLLSITDDVFRESERDDILAQLREAPAASLFVLSRTAASEEVRSEAATLLNARLRESEDDIPSSNAPNLEELPPELATHRHFYKFCEDSRWVLTTRSGVRVTTFASEAELDQWWHRLKWQRGRILTRTRSAFGA
jgi:hypothetical protein